MGDWKRNWLQEHLWVTNGITYARTNENYWLGPGLLCMKCGAFVEGETGLRGWTCPTCGYRHKRHNGYMW